MDPNPIARDDRLLANYAAKVHILDPPHGNRFSRNFGVDSSPRSLALGLIWLFTCGATNTDRKRATRRMTGAAALSIIADTKTGSFYEVARATDSRFPGLVQTTSSRLDRSSLRSEAGSMVLEKGTANEVEPPKALCSTSQRATARMA